MTKPLLLAALLVAGPAVSERESVQALAQRADVAFAGPRAVELFDRFLLSDPPEEQAAAAKARRAECTDEPPPEPKRAAERSPPPPRVIEPEPEPEPPPPTRDRPRATGPALVGVGSGVAIIGAALVGASFGTAARAPDAMTQDEYRARARRVVPLAAAGWTSLAVGIAVAIAGGIAWGVAKRRRGK
jgi:hypothetical protein